MNVVGFEAEHHGSTNVGQHRNVVGSRRAVSRLVAIRVIVVDISRSLPTP